MSKGKKYKIPHKYLSKYPIRKGARYKVMGGKNGEKAKFKFFRHKKKTLEDSRRSYIYEKDGIKKYLVLGLIWIENSLSR